MTNQIKRNHFYGHSISVRYASPAFKFKLFLISGCIETRGDSPLIIHIGGNVIKLFVLSQNFKAIA